MLSASTALGISWRSDCPTGFHNLPARYPMYIFAFYSSSMAFAELDRTVKAAKPEVNLCLLNPGQLFPASRKIWTAVNCRRSGLIVQGDTINNSRSSSRHAVNCDFNLSGSNPGRMDSDKMVRTSHKPM